MAKDKKTEANNNQRTLLNLEGIMAIPYNKEGDSTEFIRRRLIGRTIINGKLCQVNGTATQIKGQ